MAITDAKTVAIPIAVTPHINCIQNEIIDVLERNNVPPVLALAILHNMIQTIEEHFDIKSSTLVTLPPGTTGHT